MNGSVYLRKLPPVVTVCAAVTKIRDEEKTRDAKKQYARHERLSRSVSILNIKIERKKNLQSLVRQRSASELDDSDISSELRDAR